MWLLMQYSQEGFMDLVTTHPTAITIAALIVGVLLAQRLAKVVCVVGAALLITGYLTGSLPW